MTAPQVSEEVLLRISHYLLGGPQGPLLLSHPYYKRPSLDLSFWRPLLEVEVERKIPSYSRPYEKSFKSQYETVKTLNETYDTFPFKGDVYLLAKSLILDLGEETIPWVLGSGLLDIFEDPRGNPLTYLRTRLARLILVKGRIEVFNFFVDLGQTKRILLTIYDRSPETLQYVPFTTKDLPERIQNLPPLENFRAYLQRCKRDLETPRHLNVVATETILSIRWTEKEIPYLEAVFEVLLPDNWKDVFDVLYISVDPQLCEYIFEKLEGKITPRMVVDLVDFCGHDDENRPYAEGEGYRETHLKVFKYLIINQGSYIASGSLGKDIEYSEEAIRFLGARKKVDLLDLEEQFYFRQDFASGTYLLKKIVERDYEGSIRTYLDHRFGKALAEWTSDEKVPGIAFEVLLKDLTDGEISLLLETSVTHTDPGSFLYALIVEGPEKFKKRATELLTRDDGDVRWLWEVYEEGYKKARAHKEIK